MGWEEKFSADASAVKASEIRELLKILSDPGVLSFAGGIPDPALFPMAELARIIASIQARPEFDRQALQYSQSERLWPT